MTALKRRSLLAHGAGTDRTWGGGRNGNTPDPPPSMTDLVLGGSDPPPSITDLVIGGSDPPPRMIDLVLGGSDPPQHDRFGAGGEVRAKIFCAPSALLNTSTEWRSPRCWGPSKSSYRLAQPVL